MPAQTITMGQQYVYIQPTLTTATTINYPTWSELMFSFFVYPDESSRLDMKVHVPFKGGTGSCIYGAAEKEKAILKIAELLKVDIAIINKSSKDGYTKAGNADLG